MKTETLETDKKLTCHHCGEDCPEQPVEFAEHVFCCHGCKTVYEILNSNDLCQYYALDDNAGRKTASIDENRFAFLDNKDIREQVIEFTDGKISRVTFFVPNIHCSSCIWLLENLHKLNPNVRHAQVNFPRKKATITFDESELTLRQLVALMARIGYAPEINLASGKKEKTSTEQKQFYIKLGIAGFCFGNIMLLSIPDYLDHAEGLEPVYRDFFGYLNLLLALPVFFYSGTEYFVSAWKGLREKYINIDVPISLGIFTLFARSSWEIVTATGTGYMDSLAGLVFFLLIGKWYQNKTYQALSFDRNYESYFPIAVTRIREQKEESVPIKSLVKGDRILVRNQELIPADGILLKGNGNIDYSFVTGESDAVSRKSGDLLYAGGRQLGASLELEITKPVVNSYLTQLWNQEIFKKEEPHRLSKLANRVSKFFTIAILFISLCTGVFWYMTDTTVIINAVTSVLIVACPCALALSIPFTFGNTLRIFGKKGFYLKNTMAIENLSAIDTIVFDKTGTLTDNRPQEVVFEGNPLSRDEKGIIQAVVKHSTHPLSKVVYAALNGSVSTMEHQVTGFKERPGEGLEAHVNGQAIQIGSQQFVTGSAGSQTIGSRVYISIGGHERGFFAIKNQYRKGLEEVLETLKPHYAMHVLSGDNDRERAFLSETFPPNSQLHFNQSPQEKLAYIEALKEKGKTVLMVGDGLNDAGALKQSDVGISISDDIYHFSPACDAILDAGQFAHLQRFIRFSKSSLNVVKSSYVLSFIYNIVGLSFAVSGMLTPLVCAILMPLSSVSVVLFVSGATSMIARVQGLGRA